MKPKMKMEPIFSLNIDWKALGIGLSAICILHIIECLLTLQTIITLFYTRIKSNVDLVNLPYLIVLLFIAVTLGTSISLILHKKKSGLTFYILYAVINLVYTLIFTKFNALSLLIILGLLALMTFFIYRKREIFV